MFFFHRHRKTAHPKESDETVILDHVVVFTHFMVGSYIAFTSWELFSLTKVISHDAETFEFLLFQSLLLLSSFTYSYFKKLLKNYYLVKHQLGSHPIGLDT